MRRTIRDLPTLAEVNARPHATPKHELETKLDRAIISLERRRLDEQMLRAWSFAVKQRDGWRDRKDGKRVRRCVELHPRRAEAHHLEPKANPVTRHDVRNGITLSYENHARVERGEYRIEGTKWFEIGGHRYIDATAPIIFVRT